MNETIKGLRRSCYCGELGEANIGEEVTVFGWCQRQRDLGGLIFIDLRDRTGIVQLAFGGDTQEETFRKAASVRSEYVLAAVGEVRRRDGNVNDKMATGAVEIAVRELRILSEAQTPPFEIGDGRKVREELALKYRYLDLRRPSLQANMLMRHKIARTAREYFYENGFYELETPMLIKSTPEGARDYIVPSRVHRGCFYALPQSPQIYKQLLMLSGFDRYIQLARCFRDEDLRADRQPEFTQIDLEMSFVDTDDVMDMLEGFIVRLMKDVMGREITGKLPRLTYAEAMDRYGSDKPDTRFGMEITNITDLVKDSGFGVFSSAAASGGSVRAIVAENAADVLTRKEIDRLTEHAKGIGAKGLAYIRWVDEAPSCSFGKFLGEGELEGITGRLSMKRGDVALIVADADGVTLPTLGALRLMLGKKLGLTDENRFDFLWIVEFPFFEYNPETGGWDAMHHPFTMPLEECLPYLETQPGKVRAKCYDLVVNGVELCSGSIRINDPALQEKMFDLLGLGKEEIENKFGFLVEAYKYGAPPHGGAGIGLDRLAMILCGADSLRDVICFPKVQNAGEVMSSCPAPVSEIQLEELGITVRPEE